MDASQGKYTIYFLDFIQNFSCNVLVPAVSPRAERGHACPCLQFYAEPWVWIGKTIIRKNKHTPEIEYAKI